jgi:hypothetical protein
MAAILALVQSISSKAAVAKMAACAAIKLNTVDAYLDRTQAARLVASHYGEPLEQAMRQIATVEKTVSAAGF